MLRYFGDATQAQARETLEGVFAALADGGSEYAVVPVENSTEGTVTRTVDLLAEQPAQITGEIVLPVAHCLLGTSGSLDGIGSVLGHPQALAQCRAWLDAHVPGLRRIPVSSSAIAAREAANLPDCVAIAGEMAAARYCLRFIARAIQDDPQNRTRFLVVGGPPAEPTGNDRTSIALTLDDAVGALARVFDALARHRVPVLWLEVRPGHEAGWAYRYFVDLGGHARDANVSAALDEITAVSRDLRMLGAYPRALRVEPARVATVAAS
jgi:chorismate mutase/prephenate dehydratase